MIKVDLTGFDRQAALVIRRVEEAFVAEYREVCMEVFWRLLHETPQFTGRAVAHWTVGIDAPEFYQDDNLGDVVNMLAGRHKKDGTFYKQDQALRKGDDKWINHAWMRNEHKFAQITRRSKVFFTNNVRGDTDLGKANENYLATLQDQGYWVEKLRSVNKPYETAAETILQVQLTRAASGRGGNGVFTYKRRRDSYANLDAYEGS